MPFTMQGCESFESGKKPFPDLWENVAGGAVTSAYAHTGTYSYLPNTTTDATLDIPISGSPDNFAMSLWVRPYANTEDFIYVEGVTSGGNVVGVREDAANGTADAYVAGSKVADGTTVLGTWADVWHNLRVYVVSHATTGTIQAWMDGHQILNWTGNTLGTTFDAIRITTVDCYLDDLVWGTGGDPGNCEVRWKTVTADTLVDDWTPSTGTDAYAVVDEVPASDSDYLYTTTNGHATELELEDFDNTNRTIVGVDVLARIKSLTATGEQVKIGVDSGGTDDTTTHDATTAFEPKRHGMATDPATGVAWTDSGVDALKARMESVIW